MVQCYSCHANLSGNWNIKLENGYNNGAYLGLDCYFAYPGVNWVYCFCQACFNNGNFANNIKTWYAAPIKSIIDAQTKNKQTQVNQLQAKLAQKQLQITQLKDKLANNQIQANQLQDKLAKKQTQANQLEVKLAKFQPQSKLISEESFNLIAKTENYERQMKRKFKIYSLQFISQLSTKLNTLIKNQSEDFINSYKHKLNQMKIKGDKDIEALRKIMDATILSLKAQKDQANNSLFEDSEVQSCEKMFLDKIKKIQENLEQICKSYNEF